MKLNIKIRFVIFYFERDLWVMKIRAALGRHLTSLLKFDSWNGEKWNRNIIKVFFLILEL
jgi:hypothetical protein